MSRYRLVIIATGFALAVGAIGARQSPQYRAGTDTVPIYATVVDRNGRLVTDLTRDDFQVFDNGAEQTLSTFANEVQPITVVMMLDRSGSVEDQFGLVGEAAAEFVRQLSPADKARIGSFSLQVQIDPEKFTSNKQELLMILRDRMQPIGPTPLWGAASAAMSALKSEPGRRVVVIFTDGRDAPLSDQPKVPFSEVRWRAETEEVMVYGIGLVDECAPAAIVPPPTSGLSARAFFDQRRPGQGRSGPPPGRGGPVGGRIRLPPPPLPLPLPPQPRTPGRPPTMPEPRVADEGGCKPEGPDPSLRTLTDVGGGGYFELHRAADLPATFSRVADELHHQYLLAFVARARDGAFHSLDVRVKRPGVTIKARRGYIAAR